MDNRPQILVLVAYLPRFPNTVDHIVSRLSEASRYSVVQRLVGLEGPPPTPQVAEVTVETIPKKVPRYLLFNKLLAQETLSQYDYVLTLDDDYLLPEGFVDRFFDIQVALGFAMAQPARIGEPTIAHPIDERQEGVAARRTFFVHVGFASFHKSIYDLVFPFDVSSPMGRGHEGIWAYRLKQRGKSMGTVDATPVRHTRMPATSYDRRDVGRQGVLLLNKHEHLLLEDCYRVLEVFGRKGNGSTEALEGRQPRISVVIPTYNQGEWLRTCLEGFLHQNLAQDDYEIAVIDNGSDDSTQEICRSFEPQLPLCILPMEHSNIRAARILGLFAARAPIILFADPENLSGQDLLRAHLNSHREHPEKETVVVGYGRWLSMSHSPLTHYVMNADAFWTLPPASEADWTKNFALLHVGGFSFKRSLLVKNRSLHRQLLQDPLETAYALVRLKLNVIFNPRAVSDRLRPIRSDELWSVCEWQGRMTYQQRSSCVDRSHEWLRSREVFDEKMRELQKDPSLYGWIVRATIAKGIFEARREDVQASALLGSLALRAQEMETRLRSIDIVAKSTWHFIQKVRSLPLFPTARRVWRRFYEDRVHQL